MLQAGLVRVSAVHGVDVQLPKYLTDQIVSLLLEDFFNLYKENYFVSEAFDLSA